MRAEASWFGSTGLLQVPTAGVVGEGEVTASASHHNPDATRLEAANIYATSLGFWQDLELSARLVEGKPGEQGGIRDLSADLKYRVLALQDGPSLAIGFQDYGGQTRFFRTRYAVATLPWRSLSATAGYGERGTALDGWFGGAQWQPSGHFALLADHANRETLGGIRLSSGRWFGQLRASLTASHGSRRHETEFGLAFTMPLGSRPKPAPVGASVGAASAATEPTPDLQALAADLRDAGFEAVRVGTRPDGSVVAMIENRVYNHSQADAVDVAMTRAAQHLQPGGDFDLILSRYGAPLITLKNRDVHAFPENRDVHAFSEFVNEVPDPDQVQWQNTPDRLRAPEIILEPVLTTFVGTEVGVVDAGLGLRLTAIAPLATGLVLAIGGEAPVALTDDMREGRDYAFYAPKARVDRAQLAYFHKPHAQWSWLWSAGRTSVYEAEFRLAALEQLLMSPSGRHQLNLKLMQLWPEEGSAHVALGGYTWFDAARDYSVSLTGGRFLAGDEGGRLELNRWFGDTQVGLYWRVAGRHEQVAGVQVSLPLTPRRDMTPGAVQIKGPARWRWSLGSTVNAADGRNPLRPLLLYEPVLDLDLRGDFFDAGRLTPDYLVIGDRKW